MDGGPRPVRGNTFRGPLDLKGAVESFCTMKRTNRCYDGREICFLCSSAIGNDLVKASGGSRRRRPAAKPGRGVDESGGLLESASGWRLMLF